VHTHRSCTSSFVVVLDPLTLDVQQFTAGFISQEILKILLNYNIYAIIKRQVNQITNSIYLYKKGFRYELFTLVMQGNATLESGIEHIMSTIGPFSCFAASALLGNRPCLLLLFDMFIVVVVVDLLQPTIELSRMFIDFSIVCSLSTLTRLI
jgi:hypothetical protein